MGLLKLRAQNSMALQGLSKFLEICEGICARCHRHAPAMINAPTRNAQIHCCTLVGLTKKRGGEKIVLQQELGKGLERPQALKVKQGIDHAGEIGSLRKDLTLATPR